MPDNPNPNPDPNQGGAAAQGQGGQPPQPAPAPQPSVYTDLKTKKGWKTDDDAANSYVEIEKTAGRRQTSIDNTKKQLEAQGVTLDEQGNIVGMGGTAQPGQGQPPYQQPQGGYPNQQGGGGYPPSQYPSQQGEPVYNLYNGQQLTNPVDIQLAQLPPSQGMAMVANVLMEQREKHQSAAFVNEQEIMVTPEAKGFEGDLRKVMMSVPLADRANKEKWKDALLRVKGASYDEHKKNWGQQGVDQFINKDNMQNVAGAGGGAGAGGAKLTPQQESNFQYYAKTKPGMFKDRAAFLQMSTSNTGGR